MIDKNKKYKTRCGYEVDIVIIIKGNEKYPVKTVVTDDNGNKERMSYTIDGKFIPDIQDPLDLIEVVEEPKLKGYVNVFQRENFVYFQFYYTLKRANQFKGIFEGFKGTIDLSTLTDKNFVKE